MNPRSIFVLALTAFATTTLGSAPAQAADLMFAASMCRASNGAQDSYLVESWGKLENNSSSTILYSCPMVYATDDSKMIRAMVIDRHYSQDVECRYSSLTDDGTLDLYFSGTTKSSGSSNSATMLQIPASGGNHWLFRQLLCTVPGKYYNNRSGVLGYYYFD